MSDLKFSKMVASGNDFVVISFSGLRSPSANLKNLAKKICNRKFGIGADGLLILEKSQIADIRMRIFNADGSEAQMCGNGARCSAFYTGKPNVKIETKAGIINAQVNRNSVKIKLTNPKDIKLNIPLHINSRTLRVNFINTGVPHTVIFVHGLDNIDVFNLGRYIRYHKKFSPRGTNVNFVEIIDENSLKIRTYERGVEDETLACGTGVVASALLYAIRYMPYASSVINVHTKSREMLKVYFEESGNNFKNVFLEGKANIIYKGVYHV